VNQDELQDGWFIIFSTEFHRIWLGWRGLALLLGFSIILSLFTVLLSLDPEINVLSQRTMVELSLQATILTGIIAVVLLGADSVSGERDQRSMESLMLTPIPRSHIATGKLMAILTLWVGMVPIAIPYLVLFAKGTDLILEALLLLIATGSLIVTICASISVLVSSLVRSNLVSFIIIFVVILLLAAPTQLPGSIQKLPSVYWFVLSNPVTAISLYQGKVLGGEPWIDNLVLLISPIFVLLLFTHFGPRFLNSWISLEGGRTQ
jgi:ABC-2 type transport system permease protein